MFRHIIALTATLAAICMPIKPSWANADNWESPILLSLDRSEIFAGQQTELHCTVTSRQSLQGRLLWSLEVHGGILAQREAAVDANAENAIRVPILLNVPTAKPNMILPATLTVSVVADGQRQVAASIRKRLWIFPENPFHDQSAWLKGLDIRMFDPQGNTRRLFRSAKIPFTRIDNLDALAKLDAGLLVVGQGVSLDEYPGLAKVMLTAASHGTAVLCLAPSEGRFVLPGTGNSLSLCPTAVTLRRADVIHELDKRLNATTWPDDGRVSICDFTISSDRGQVVARINEFTQNWSWLEARFSPAKGHLIVCTFDIVGKWESSPTPRYLLARLLEYLNKTESLTLTKEKSDGT